ncbi:MltA domain-containing protein [Desulfonatronovibrio hydrogenovorans]|uniref:MltA domain-containing protein n=1 Tax=Desulfonatronovibrio hydrogenovorans TaxID=53245 RepID=UPI000491AB71|nr:MltA domain-containing protein [Desulfonatronovibrio hydrogenovorans]
MVFEPSTMKNHLFGLIIGLSLSAILSCAPREPVMIPEPEPEPVMDIFVPADPAKVMEVLEKGLTAQGLDSWKELETPLKRSLRYVRTRDMDARAVCVPGLCLKWKDINETLETLLFLLPDIDRNPGILEYFFDFYALDPDILLTGYYEPLLEASREAHPEYPYPVYALPDDLKTLNLGRFHPRWQGQTLVYRLENGTVEPYHDRKDIDLLGALKDRDLEIAWVREMVDLFFLHIQGSGRLRYGDGRYEHVLYAGRNGLQYVALGRVLADRGYLEPEEVTMQSIRRVLGEHPDIAPVLMAENPSYIFFRLEDHGPKGSTGQILTPYVSVASDPAVIPWGSVMILDAVLPEYLEQETQVTGPVLAQDTGGAIRGRHLDLFCGFGPKAESLAGRMKDRANVYLMVRKNDQD